ncbi:MAG: YqgE/AlgH family protein [Opitutaceae bacterium]|jgi:putative transcriptional regulator
MRTRRVSSRSESELSGSLLLAHPALRDPSFRRSVVLISSHDSEGAMGVVLNRPLGRTLGELDAAFALGPLAGVPVYRGGPVREEQLILCAWQVEPSGTELKLYFGLEPEKAIELRGEAGFEIRAFLGHAGWSGGQLEEELDRDAWVVMPVGSDLLEFQPDETLWRGLLSGLHPEWRILAEEPDDPSLN